MEHSQTITDRTIYGFSPLVLDDAQHIIANPSDFPSLKRVLAFRTIKANRGQKLSEAFVGQCIRQAMKTTAPNAPISSATEWPSRKQQ